MHWVAGVISRGGRGHKQGRAGVIGRHNRCCERERGKGEQVSRTSLFNSTCIKSQNRLTSTDK